MVSPDAEHPAVQQSDLVLPIRQGFSHQTSLCQEVTQPGTPACVRWLGEFGVFLNSQVNVDTNTEASPAIRGIATEFPALPA